MSHHNESIGKTLWVILALCLVCSVIVSSTAVGLKQRQQVQKQLDQQRNILIAARLLNPHGTEKEDETVVHALFSQHVTPRLVDLNSGEFSSLDPALFNERTAEKDPTQSLYLDHNIDIANIQRRANLKQVYLIKDKTYQQTPSSIVLSVHGRGLWSMMYAFVALNIDGNTVKNIVYYEHGETPGLGGEIENPTWQQQWIGKKLFNDQGKPALRLLKSSSVKSDIHTVDALSGASLTSKGVQNTFDFWLGKSGYGPFLAKVRAGVLFHD